MKLGKIISTSLVVLVTLLAVWGWLNFAANPLKDGAQLWSGVDESVVEKFAKESGRETVTPLINTDQGDLLLFVFALGGATAGFIAGYNLRDLISKEQKKAT